MASLTSPVSVWLFPPANAGTAAIPNSSCIPTTAIAIRFIFILAFSPRRRLDTSSCQDIAHHTTSQGTIISGPNISECLCLLHLEMDCHVHRLALGVQFFVQSDRKLQAPG